MGIVPSVLRTPPKIAKIEAMGSLATPKPSGLETLAEVCLQEARTLSESFASNDYGRLGFDSKALSMFPKSDEKTQRARNDLRNAAKALYDMATGPQECLMEASLTSLQFVGCMRYLCHFKIPDAVPEDGEIEYHALATKCGLDTAQLKQYLRYAIANRVFIEPTTNTVAHTAASLLLIEGRSARPPVQWLTEYCAPMIAHQVDAMEKWGHGSQESNQTAVNFAYGVDGAFYDFISADPVRERLFGKAIQGVLEQPSSSVNHVRDGFDWTLLGEGTVIDVGGHIGYCAGAIVQASPKLNVIVQDLSGIVAIAEDPKTAAVPEELRDRVKFEVHDFFEPQKTPANAYFYRKVFLNHTDKNAVKIIEALRLVLKPGNRLLIMDFVQADKTVETTAPERYYRAVDLQMLLYYNTRFRRLEEWKALVKSGDQRLEFEGEFKSQGSAMPILSFIVR